MSHLQSENWIAWERCVGQGQRGVHFIIHPGHISDSTSSSSYEMVFDHNTMKMEKFEMISERQEAAWRKCMIDDKVYTMCCPNTISPHRRARHGCWEIYESLLGPKLRPRWTLAESLPLARVHFFESAPERNSALFVACTVGSFQERKRLVVGEWKVYMFILFFCVFSLSIPFIL